MLHVGVCCAVVSVPCRLGRADRFAVMSVVFCHFPQCVQVHTRVKDEVGAMKLV